MTATADTCETTWTPEDSAALDAELVAHDGHRLRLRGEARRLAIAAMARLGVPADEMARRLCMGREALATYARRARIEVPVGDLRRWAVVVDLPEIRERDRQRGRRRAVA